MNPEAQALLNDLREKLRTVYQEAQRVQGDVAIIQMKLAELVEELGAKQ